MFSLFFSIILCANLIEKMYILIERIFLNNIWYMHNWYFLGYEGVYRSCEQVQSRKTSRASIVEHSGEIFSGAKVRGSTSFSSVRAARSHQKKRGTSSFASYSGTLTQRTTHRKIYCPGKLKGLINARTLNCLRYAARQRSKRTYQLM